MILFATMKQLHLLPSLGHYTLIELLNSHLCVTFILRLQTLKVIKFWKITLMVMPEFLSLLIYIKKPFQKLFLLIFLPMQFIETIYELKITFSTFLLVLNI